MLSCLFQVAVHSWEDGNLHIRVPAEVYSSAHPTQKLAEELEWGLNRDLVLGLDQTAALKTALSLRKMWRRLGALTAAGTLEGVMIATSDSKAAEDLVARGSVGAAAGAAAVAALVFAHSSRMVAKHDSSAAPAARRVYKRAAKIQEKKIKEGDYQFGEHIISVVPAGRIILRL
jgi:hypothetical protein